MRIVLLSVFTLLLSLHSALLPAYDGEDYPQPEQYPDASYPEESYPPEGMPDQTQPEYGMPETDTPAAPDYAPAAEPENANHELEIRRMCQESAAGVPDEEKDQFVEDCVHSQGY